MSKLTVRELKEYIKQNRPQIQGYSVSKKSKKDLSNLYYKIQSEGARDLTIYSDLGRIAPMKKNVNIEKKPKQKTKYNIEIDRINDIIRILQNDYKTIDMDNKKNREDKAEVMGMIEELNQRLTSLLSEHMKLKKLPSKVKEHKEILYLMDDFIINLSKDFRDLKKSNESIHKILSNYDSVVKIVNSTAKDVDNIKDTYPEVKKNLNALSDRVNNLENLNNDIIDDIEMLATQMKELKKFIGAKNKAARVLL